MILAVAIVFAMFVFAAVWASRYVKVGPNRVLVVSGRRVRQPDGSFVGYRIVKGGGTFVIPIVERLDVLSLEVITVEMPWARAQVAGGHAVKADCVAQVKVNSDDASLAAAIEHFLSKRQGEIARIVGSVLEKHLAEVLATATLESVIQNPAVCAALVQTSAAGDLGKMGLSMLGFTIRSVRGE